MLGRKDGQIDIGGHEIRGGDETVTSWALFFFNCWPDEK